MPEYGTISDDEFDERSPNAIRRARITELRAEIAEAHRLGRVPERQLCELYDLQDDDDQGAIDDD